MKNKLYRVAMLTTLTMGLCACNSANDNVINNTPLTTDNASNDVTQDISQKTNENVQAKQDDKEAALQITTMGDYNELAMSMSDLVENADMILKIKVDSTSAFINEIGMIQTEITPIVEEVYKGSYNGEQLYVNGGMMLYEEYSQNEIIKEAVSGHENPDGEEDYTGKYVVQSVDDQYIFEEGEEYIFFAREREDVGKYYSLYAYQGTFKVEDGEVCNEALQEDEELKQDIDSLFASNSRSASNSVSVEDFVEVIDNLK